MNICEGLLLNNPIRFLLISPDIQDVSKEYEDIT